MSTTQIQLRVSGAGAKVKRVAQRRFGTTKEAREYLDELVGEIKLVYSRDGTLAEPKVKKRTDTFWHIWSNYDVRKILKGRKPRSPLPEILTDMTPAQLIAQVPMPRKTRASKKQKAKRISATKPGAYVTLHQICKDLDVIPKKARIKLRAAVKKGTIEHAGSRWEWEDGSRQLELVKELLS